MDQDRNKNLDIINLLQNLRESVNLQEDSGEVKEVKKVSFEDTEIDTWFERDRQHVELRYKDAGETIMEWWDDEVSQAVEDGFLDPENYHLSAYDYAVSLGKIQEAAKVPQTMQPKDKLEDNPEIVGMKDGEVSDVPKDREDVIKEIPDKDLEKLPTQENRQLRLCNSCCKVFRANESKCPHCQSTLVESITSSVSKKNEAKKKPRIENVYSLTWKDSREPESSPRYNYKGMYGKTPEEAINRLRNIYRSAVNIKAKLEKSDVEVEENIKEDQGLRKHEDQIPGGLADRNQPEDFPPEQITMGIKVELEHTNDANLAREIAMDHLKEDPEYYTKLMDMEAGELDKSTEESKVNEAEDSEHWAVFSNSKYGKNKLTSWFDSKREAEDFKNSLEVPYVIGNVEYTPEIISDKDVEDKSESVKEAEDSDIMQIVSKGIVDKATADKLAAEQRGMVITDDVDKVKFMVIRKKE